MKKKSIAVFTAGLILMVGVAFIFVYEYYIEPKVNTVPVVVAASDINFKEPISEDALKVVQVKKDNLVNGAYQTQDINEIKNNYAAIDIKEGTQLYEALIDSYSLVPDEKKGEFIAPIPDEWLFAVPGSLRRAFVADFYAIPDEDQQMLKQIVNEANNEDSNKDEDKEQPIETNKDTDTVLKQVIDGEPILKNVRVASVKDSSNSEVKNVEDQESGKTSTGVISNLEIISTSEMLQSLRDYTEMGYKIYVVYKYER